ncbi:MAG TPA: carboxypeptidase regulatory-like domain-containing protein [Nocardioides sp.]|jgi:protocatechuate 3,4-dioxygenase alpha subunit|nr:carboxypeptidase regulatory-like domain-containing protein [Nocardioides sp.]
MSLAPTPGQTVGPFFSFALAREGYADLVSPGHPDAITLRGQVLDGAGEPVPDALVELTRGNGGWGRAATDDEGRYTFTTLAPIGPFFAITVFARGLLDRLFTRAYLPDAADHPFLQALPQDRRATLVATADERGYLFDIRLQGDDETVFLAFPRD